MILTENFKNAIYDYIYLLEKEYPQKAILKLIGDRYLLSGIQRTMLYRGITTKENLLKRTSKLITENLLSNQILHIDGYNVLITIGSYLNGNTVFVGNDNFLRDASESHGKIFRTELFDKSLVLIFDYLKKINIKEVFFYLDKPVSFSGKLCLKIDKQLKNYKIQGKAETFNSPDFHLKNIKEGYCATSDSTIIDNSKVKVFDLARNTILFHFKPEFIIVART